MEYIKNIVHHYMCTNSTGRQQMIPALATALHFCLEIDRSACYRTADLSIECNVYVLVGVGQYTSIT